LTFFSTLSLIATNDWFELEVEVEAEVTTLQPYKKFDRGANIEALGWGRIDSAVESVLLVVMSLSKFRRSFD